MFDLKTQNRGWRETRDSDEPWTDEPCTNSSVPGGFKSQNLIGTFESLSMCI